MTTNETSEWLVNFRYGKLNTTVPTDMTKKDLQMNITETTQWQQRDLQMTTKETYKQL